MSRRHCENKQGSEFVDIWRDMSMCRIERIPLSLCAAIGFDLWVLGGVRFEKMSHQKALSSQAKKSTSGVSPLLVLGSDRGEFVKFEPPHHSTLNTLQPDFEKNPFFVSTFLHPANLQIKLACFKSMKHLQMETTH